MISPFDFLTALKEHDIDTYYGVPDSLLKSFDQALSDSTSVRSHSIVPNEGIAVSRAIGYFAATRQIPVVYMQNSGLGNAVNPLLSLADAQVCGVPMLLVVGWRGEMIGQEQITDEPQHRKQGRVTLELIESMGYSYFIVDKASCYKTIIDESVELAKRKHEPVFLVVRKDTFSNVKSERPENRFDMTREASIKSVLALLPDTCITVATTGKIGREVFELRQSLKMPHYSDFLCVGGMGHASSIASEIACYKPERTVVCFDGDGAALMHLASMQHAACQKNLLHIILNNCVHESVGGQSTTFDELDAASLARTFGYARFSYITDEKTLCRQTALFLLAPESTLLIVGCKIGSRIDLGRPTVSSKEQYASFSKFVIGL